MQDQEKVIKILELVGKIAKNYFSENIDNDIKDFNES